MGADEATTQTDLRTARLDQPESALPVLVIAFHDEPAHIGRRLVLVDGDELVLGRGGDAFGEGVLASHKLSRRHAAVRRVGERVWVRDLASRNGTYVNDEPIEERELDEHDVIDVGRVLLLFAHRPVLPRRKPNERLLGRSAAHDTLMAQIDAAAPGEVPVLIRGETGVGKELVAQAVHARSARDGPLVSVNCAALSDGVLHSELFGHLRGAFSGASEDRKGLVARASGGSLLLDEIGDATPLFQATLLRLLEQREYRPVGSDRIHHSEARILAATHVALEQAVETGHFRRDLWSRLERSVVHVPALRQRPEDIMVLAHHFAEQAAGRPMRFRRTAALALLRHSWRRNVRQLRAVVEQAVRHTTGEAIVLDGLAAELRKTAREDVGGEPAAAGRPTPDALRAQLRRHAGNVTLVAREMGVSRNTVYRWMSRFDIDWQKLRDRPES